MNSKLMIVSMSLLAVAVSYALRKDSAPSPAYRCLRSPDSIVFLA